MASYDSYVTANQKFLPTLGLAETTARSITGTNLFGDSQGSGDGPTEATNTGFTVTPSSIAGAEKAILTELSTQVTDFETFKNNVLEKGGWVFLVQRPEYLVPHYHDQGDYGPNGVNGPAAVSDLVPPATTGTYADYVDPDPKSTQKLVDTQIALIKSVGDSIEVAGQLVARLNNAAQIYADADQKSFGTAVAPAVPTTTGT